MNTIIVLFSAPDEAQEWGLDQMARFVMFKVPFEHVLSSVVFEEIDVADKRRMTPEYRVHPASQKKLLEEGCAVSEEEEGAPGTRGKGGSGPLIKVARYIGNKWGGKYLRAPDIYWTILEKGKGKLVRLGDIAEIMTVSWSRQGQNEKLMSSKRGADRSKEVVDVLKSPKDISKIKLTRRDTCHLLRMQNWVKEQLVYAPILWVDLRGDKHIVHLCLEPIAFTHNFHGIRPFNESSANLLCAVFNSTLSWLFIEVLGRRGLGGGAVRVLVEDLRFQFPVLDPAAITPPHGAELLKAFEQISTRDIRSVFEEMDQPDHRNLDAAVFDALNLSKGEREGVHEAVSKLVRERFEKAESV